MTRVINKNRCTCQMMMVIVSTDCDEFDASIRTMSITLSFTVRILFSSHTLLVVHVRRV